MLLETVENTDVSASHLNSDLLEISEWLDKWLVTMNPSKCRFMVFFLIHEKRIHPALTLDGVHIKEVESQTQLELTFQVNMSWRSYIQNIFKNASKRLNMLKLLRYRGNRTTLVCLYKSLIRPLMEYGDVISDNSINGESQLLEGIQYDSARVASGAIKDASTGALMNELAWEDLSTRKEMHNLAYFFKIVRNISPLYLVELLPGTVDERVHFSLRSSENLYFFLCRTARFQQSFFSSTINLWNSLIVDISHSISLPIFKAKLKSVFLSRKV